MKKTILHPAHRQELLDRIAKLQAEDQAHWGSMQVEEMLAHAREVAAAVLKSPLPEKKANWKQLLGKYYFFYLRKEFPKLVKGPKRFDMKGKVSREKFIEEKQGLLDTLQAFSSITHQLQGFHPFFGPLSHQEWGVLVWKHTDHHLRQFGV